MSLTFDHARQEMYRQINTPWVLANPTFPLFFEDRANQKPTEGVPYGRVFVRHNLGYQESLTNPIGQKMFARDGLITIQVFTPMGAGLQQSDTLAKLVADALEGKATPGGVWFRRCRIHEVGASGSFFQMNVTSEFEYNEIK